MKIPKTDPHYRAIEMFYYGKRAKRSGVPYIDHIDQGLLVLEAIDANEDAQRAYCLHPIVQADDDLTRAFGLGGPLDLYPVTLAAVSLAIEYRCVANAYLSTRKLTRNVFREVQLGPMPEVAQMLIADKIQNRKDFLQYHVDSHPRSQELQTYFHNWLVRLKISNDKCEELTAICGG